MATSVITPVAPVTSAPAPAAPAAPVAAPQSASNASMSDLISQAGRDAAANLAAAAAAAPAIDNPEVAPPATPATPEGAPPASAAPEVPVTGETEEQTPLDAILDFSDGLDPDSKSEDGKRFFTTPAKWDRLTRAAKLVQSLQEVMPNITPEAVSDKIQQANAADHMMTLFWQAAENPGAIKEVVDVFTGFGDPAPQERAAFSAMVMEGLSRLPQINPQAFQHVLKVHNDFTVNNLRQQARNTTDASARQQAINLALLFEKHATGNYTPSEQWIGANPNLSPEQQRFQNLEQREAAFRQQQQNAAQQHRQQWINHVDTSAITARAEVIEKSLLKDKFESGGHWDAMRFELGENIAKAERDHPEWAVQFHNLYNQALVQPNEANLKAVTDFRRAIAERVARTNAPTIINKYSTLQMQQNQNIIARAGQVHNEASPAGSPTPAPNGALQKAIANPDLRSSLKDLFATAR